jgi:hypothetical protein
MVETAGAALFSGLTARKLLILRMAGGPRKGTIADSIIRLLYRIIPTTVLCAARLPGLGAAAS